MLLPILPQPASLWLSKNLSETFYWPARLIYELPCHHQSSIFSWYALPTFTKKGNQKVRGGGKIKTSLLGLGDCFFFTIFKGGPFLLDIFPNHKSFSCFDFFSWLRILRRGILERLSDCSSYFQLVTEWINITKRHKLTLIVVLSCCRRCTDCHKYVTVCISSVAEHISIILMIMRTTMMTMTKIMIVVLNQRPTTIGCRRHFKLFKRTLHRGYNHDDREEL